MTEAVKANETANQLDPENSQEPRQEIRDREKFRKLNFMKNHTSRRTVQTVPQEHELWSRALEDESVTRTLKSRISERSNTTRILKFFLRRHPFGDAFRCEPSRVGQKGVVSV